MRSRLLSVREKKDFRQAGGLIAGTIILIIGFLFWGLPMIASVMGNIFVRDGVNRRDEIILKPTIPVLSDVPEATNSASLTIGGYAQSGVTVHLIINGTDISNMLARDDGIFTFPNINLDEGEQEIRVYSVASSNTESEMSRVYKVKVDKTKPKLVIDSPAMGSVFHGERERLVTISGSVDEDGAKVLVGDRMAIVSTDKTFSLSYLLNEGDQEIIIKGNDRAGNETEEKLTLRWEK